jgi:RNA polymerase sigma-70 factor (ECF subfamily)
VSVQVASGQPFDELLDPARRGDGAALAELWRRHAPAVARFVRGAGAEDPDAVVSDVFLGAFAGLARFRGDEGGFRALLFTIARRRLADEARRRARRVPTTDWQATDRLTAPSVETEVFGTSTGTPEVLDLVRGLPPDQRDVVLLRLVADLPIATVASILGKRPGAVKSLQHRALDSLRRLLAADDPEPSSGRNP